MFAVSGVSAAAHLRTQSEMNGILRRLESAGSRMMLRAAAKAMAESVNLVRGCADGTWLTQLSTDRNVMAESVVGDLFAQDNSLFVLQPRAKVLELWELRSHSDGSLLEQVTDLVAAAARASIDGRRLRGMNFDWQPVRPRRLISTTTTTTTTRPRPPQLATSSPSYSDDELCCASLLVKEEARSFALRLAQVRKARSSDAQAEGGRAEAAALLEAGMLNREFLVLCRQDSHTLCTVERHEELLNGSPTIRCSVCGRPFSEELTQEIYALTDLGRGLLNGSHWMTVWLTSLLVGAGLPLDRIAWGATSGEDELDIVAEVGGQKIFFELKDRDFGLGDAYPFNSRIMRYGGSFGVIATTNTVAPEVKAFLAEQRRPAIT